VQVNGHEIPAAPDNGYSVWDTPNGWRMLQADLRGDAGGANRYVMMVRYE